jgi:hypothetical protein
MDLLESLRMMAGYNRWMNERRLYSICEGLSDEERKRDRRTFFRSYSRHFQPPAPDRSWVDGAFQREAMAVRLA